MMSDVGGGESDGGRPIHLISSHVGECTDANIGKNDGFGALAKNGESHTRYCLSLWREIIPGIVSHRDSAGKQADNAR